MDVQMDEARGTRKKVVRRAGRCEEEGDEGEGDLKGGRVGQREVRAEKKLLSATSVGAVVLKGSMAFWREECRKEWERGSEVVGN